MRTRLSVLTAVALLAAGAASSGSSLAPAHRQGSRCDA